MFDNRMGLRQSNHNTDDLKQWQLTKWMTLLISIKYSDSLYGQLHIGSSAK